VREASKKRIQKILENPNLKPESHEQLSWTLKLMNAEEN